MSNCSTSERQVLTGRGPITSSDSCLWCRLELAVALWPQLAASFDKRPIFQTDILGVGFSQLAERLGPLVVVNPENLHGSYTLRLDRCDEWCLAGFFAKVINP